MKYEWHNIVPIPPKEIIIILTPAELSTISYALRDSSLFKDSDLTKAIVAAEMAKDD